MKMTVDVTKYRKRRKKQDMTKAFHYQLQRWTGRTVKRIIRNLSGPILKTRTAQLRRSITGKAQSVGTVASSIVGSGIFGRKPVKYARIQEKGGKIRPKKAKMLTIPLPGIKGVAANFPDAFIITSKKGNVLLVERKGTGLRPLFVLKKEVTIPASHWLSRSIDEMMPELRRLLKPGEIVKIMAKMGG